MERLLLNNSVWSVYGRLRTFAQQIRDVLVEFNPSFDEFYTLAAQIKLVHRGALTLIQIINGPLDEFTAHGLRTSEEEWENPPATSREAMEEVERVLIAMELCINLRNGRRLVNDHSVFFRQFDEAISYIQSIYTWGPRYRYANLVDGVTPTLTAQRPGATYEQICQTSCSRRGGY